MKCAVFAQRRAGRQERRRRSAGGNQHRRRCRTRRHRGGTSKNAQRAMFMRCQRYGRPGRRWRSSVMRSANHAHDPRVIGQYRGTRERRRSGQQRGKQHRTQGNQRGQFLAAAREHKRIISPFRALRQAGRWSPPAVAATARNPVPALSLWYVWCFPSSCTPRHHDRRHPRTRFHRRPQNLSADPRHRARRVDTVDYRDRPDRMATDHHRDARHDDGRRGRGHCHARAGVFRLRIRQHLHLRRCAHRPETFCQRSGARSARSEIA